MKKNSGKKREETRLSGPGLGRRELMKMGVGAGVAVVTQALHAPAAVAQDKEQESTLATVTGRRGGVVPGGPPYLTPHELTRRVAKYGWKNDSGRSFGNGALDETSKKIVAYVNSFSTTVTDQMMKDISVMLVDTIGCGISALNTDSIRGCLKVAQFYPGAALKSTIWGYGVTVTPEIAGFVNACMVRHYDNNNAGMHETDVVPGILAIGEALHSSGAQVLQAMISAWEVFAALQSAKYAPGAPGNGGATAGIDNVDHAPMMAMAAGKLMGLNEDQLGNALSLSFVGHLPMRVEHWEGPYSMSKGNHDAELIRAGIFAALCARAGITGPAEPYEGGKGLQDMIRGSFKLTIPTKIGPDVGGYYTRPIPAGDTRFAIQQMVPKRLPGNGGVPISQLVPAFRKFAKTDEIESVDIQVRQWGDGMDPRKWDPLNSETADHSLSYCFARLMVDGDLFIDAYEMDKLTDPAIRQFMGKMVIRENPDLQLTRVTVRKKSGEELTQETGDYKTPMTQEAVDKKFDRNCAYRGVTNEQRDKIRAAWADLRSVKDIGTPIRETLAHFGKPLPV